MTFTNVIVIGLVILTLNLFAFAAFGWDKRCARRNMRRIPEATLLQLAFFGGTLGAKFGQRYFRHKTYKQPFSNRLNTIAMSQIIVLPLVLFPPSRAVLADMFGAVYILLMN